MQYFLHITLPAEILMLTAQPTHFVHRPLHDLLHRELHDQTFYSRTYGLCHLIGR